MRHTPISTVLAVVLTTLATPMAAQTQAPANEPFASENAILNTSILFAIGAREAQQELRGAFGWPTFQEGLVEGVYFRFDPDGYARFAPTPRLDTDVFEVICRPRTYSCMGRKQTLSMMLNTQGQLQLKIDDVVQGDQFFVVEGVSELPVPDRILMPLEPRLESLLAAGGELVVRRGENELARIPLTGFNAVASYLRWIAARQDYTILPRGWPVPNSTNGTDPAGLTQTATWQSPMPQPQMQPIIPAADQAPDMGVGVRSEVAEVRGELNILRELLLERSGQAIPQADPPVPAAGNDRIADLERAAADIQRQLSTLRAPGGAALPPLETGMTGGQYLPAQDYAMGAGSTSPALPATAIASPGGPAVTTTPPDWPGRAPVMAGGGQVMPSEGISTAAPDAVAASPASGQEAIARRLSYLITEIGLDPKSALLLLEAGGHAVAPAGVATAEDQLLDGILRDLSVLPQPVAAASGIGTPEQGAMPAATPGLAGVTLPADEFQLLSDYFRSVLQPVPIQGMPASPATMPAAGMDAPVQAVVLPLPAPPASASAFGTVLPAVSAP